MPEVWTRMAGLCALALKPDLGTSLAPLQLCASVRGGSQNIAHALRAGIASRPGTVTVGIDMRNAFNSIRRQAVVDAVAARAPALLPFTQWAYAHHSRLWVVGAPPDAPPVSSQTGVRQGDPAGPLLFSLALQGPLEQVSRDFPQVHAVAYADDCYLQGPAEAVVAAFADFCDTIRPLGLTVVPGKSFAYSEDLAASARVAAELEVEHAAEGFVAAGTPIGTDAYVARHLQDLLDAAEGELQTLKGLPLPAQDRLILLRWSFHPRVAHLPRTIPAGQVAQGVLGWGRRLRQEVADMVGWEVDFDEGSPADTQMSLPTRYGGLGLPSWTNDMADAAFLASGRLAHDAMAGGAQSLQPFAGPYGDQMEARWARLRPLGPPEWQERPLLQPDGTPDPSLGSAQREFAHFTATAAADALLARFDDHSSESRRERARLLSCRCRPATSWADALPTAPTLRMTDSAVFNVIRFQFGTTGAGGTPGCPVVPKCACGRARATLDHAMVCPSLKGERTMRHNMQTYAWRRAYSRSGTSTSLEPLLNRLDPASRDTMQRGDILLAGARGVQVVDVSVTHPTAVRTLVAAAYTAGAAAAVRDEQKRKKYAAAGDAAPYAFTPLTVETYGRMGGPAMAHLSELGDLAVANAPLGTRVTKSRFIEGALRELSVALANGNDVIVRRFLGYQARASGSAFQPGLAVPTADVDHL